MVEKRKKNQYNFQIQTEIDIALCGVFVYVWRISQPNGFFNRFDSEFGSGCQQARLWTNINRKTGRLMLCSLCLLSHCSKSVYSKSLDIPDASTKCSKEERYSLALFTSSCSVSHSPTQGDVHGRRKMQRCFLLKEYFFCLNGDYICSMWRLHKSILICYNPCEKEGGSNSFRMTVPKVWLNSFN